MTAQSVKSNAWFCCGLLSVRVTVGLLTKRSGTDVTPLSSQTPPEVNLRRDLARPLVCERGTLTRQLFDFLCRMYTGTRWVLQSYRTAAVIECCHVNTLTIIVWPAQISTPTLGWWISSLDEAVTLINLKSLMVNADCTALALEQVFLTAGLGLSRVKAK